MALTQITEKGIKDGEIINADINASAAIAGTKIAPDFGSQNVVTTGSIGIGIGSQTPSTPQKQLHIAHDSSPRIMLSNDTTGHATPNGTELLLDSGGNFEILQRENLNLEFFTNNSQRMTITGSGDVGIGTASPDRTIHCHNSSNTTNVRAKFSNGTTGEGASDGFEIGINGSDPAQAVLVNYENSPMAFFTNATERMRINSSGYVGINDTVPTGTLHVKAHTNNWHGGLVLEDPDGDTGWNVHPDNSDALMFGRNTDTGSSSNNPTYIAAFNSNGLSFPSGKGIDFSATSDASGMSEEILDDYEEGYWSPTAVDGKSLTVTAGTSNHASRRYVKIGHQVTAWFSITFSGSNSSANFITRFGGLPFSPQGNTNGSASVCIGYFTGSETDMLVGHIEQSTSLVTFYENGNSMYSYSESAGDRIDGYVTYFAV